MDKLRLQVCFFLFFSYVFLVPKAILLMFLYLVATKELNSEVVCLLLCSGADSTDVDQNGLEIFSKIDTGFSFYFSVRSVPFALPFEGVLDKCLVFLFGFLFFQSSACLLF